MVLFAFTEHVFQPKRKTSNILCEGGEAESIDYWILRGPLSSSFWLPRNLSNHMDSQARTGDSVLVKDDRKHNA
jgi:hypothetical protein